MNYHQACWAYTVYKKICYKKETDGRTVELFIAPDDGHSLFVHHQLHNSGCHCKVQKDIDFQVWVFIGADPYFILLEDYLQTEIATSN